MLRLYGLTDERKREALLALARKSRERGWWHAYRNVVAPTSSTTSASRTAPTRSAPSRPCWCPGLLQTEDYSRSVAAIFPRPEPPEVVDQQVEIRQRRQEMLPTSPTRCHST